MSGPVGLYLRLLCFFLFCPLLSPIFYFPPPCSPASRSVSSLRFSGWIRGLSWRPVQWPHPGEARVRFSPLQQHRVGKESVVGGPWAGSGGRGGRGRRRGRQKHSRSRPTAGGAIEQWRWWRKENRRRWHSGGRPTVREGWKGKCFGPQKSVSTGRLEIAWWSGE